MIEKYTTVQSVSCSQAYFHICLLWPWPLTFDLRPTTSKNNSSFSHHGLHVCQVWSRSTQRFSLFCVHKLISIYVHCDLDLWPLTSKINKVHPLIMVNRSIKFDKVTSNGLVSILFTRSMHGRTDGWTDARTEPQQRYYIPTATRCTGVKKPLPNMKNPNINMKSRFWKHSTMPGFGVWDCPPAFLLLATYDSAMIMAKPKVQTLPCTMRNIGIILLYRHSLRNTDPVNKKI